MTKKIWIICILLCGCFALNLFASQDNEDAIAYRVTRSDYTFSKEFNMAYEKTPIGKVVKSIFHLTTHYDAYDRYGLYEGQGICRTIFNPLGLFYTWATDIDVYDANDKIIGMIDGQFGSTEPAKFTFYDYNYEDSTVAIAYLDRNAMGFNIVDPHNSNLVLARLTRNFIADTIDNWDVVIFFPEKVRPLLVKVFAAFACDKQHKFKPDL